MTREEAIRDSVRAELKAEIPNIDRWRRNWRLIGETGDVKAFTFKRAFADYNEYGICTDIRCYGVGEAIAIHHHNGTGCVNISQIINDWLLDYAYPFRNARKCRNVVIDRITSLILDAYISNREGA